VEFLVVEFGDVADGRVDPREEFLLAGIVEDVRLKDGHVDPTQEFEIDDVPERSLANDRHHTPGGAVIDDACEILGDAH